MFQLGKWGFATAKVDENIVVSPVFKQYYDLTIQQRNLKMTSISHYGVSIVCIAELRYLQICWKS
jgi:hypothetical protein